MVAQLLEVLAVKQLVMLAGLSEVLAVGKQGVLAQAHNCYSFHRVHYLYKAIQVNT